MYKKLPRSKKKLSITAAQKTFIAIALLTIAAQTQAQNATQGVAAITQAQGFVTTYFDAGILLMYAIGAVVGLIGAIKVYNAWSHGDQNTNKLAASWFGACIFLVVVASALKSFFNVT